jgi:hypothetical protein
MESYTKIKEVMAKGRTENQRKFYMECRKKLQLGFDTNIQEKANEHQQFEASCIYYSWFI